MQKKNHISALLTMLVMVLMLVSSCTKEELMAPSNLTEKSMEIDELVSDDCGNITDDTDDEEDADGEITDDTDDEEDEDGEITDDTDDEEDEDGEVSDSDAELNTRQSQGKR